MARSRFRTRGFTKRGTFWGRSPADAAATGLAGQTAVLDSTAVPVVEGETIVRTRGQILIASDQSSATESYAGAVGMCIATDQAVAVGVGSIPTLYSDQDSDLWFVHQYFAGGILFKDATGVNPNRFTSFPFDSKGMRKFVTGTTLCVVVENGSSAGTGIEYWLQFAMLFKVA